MNPHSRIARRSLLSLGAAAPAFLSSLQGAAQKRPNILLIMADDLGQECLGCYGGTSYRTPHLDRFAAQGIRFTHAYAQPLCTPTRVQLMTGQHNFRNWQGFGLMRPEEKTFGHMMQRAGYRTVISGKWQFYSYENSKSPRYAKGMLPQQSGFDEFLLWHDRYTEDKGSRYADPVVNENGKLRTGTKGQYGEDLFCDFIDKFIERTAAANKDQPFFAYYPMALTHAPFNPTPKSKDWAAGNRLKDDSKYFGDMVEYMDDVIGRVVANLDRRGLRDNTLVMFYGDNGSPPEIKSQQNGRTIPGGKGYTTDYGMHVPLIAQWQGKTRAGTVCRDLIDSTDFLPTICETTGAKWFDGLPLDGRSFLPQVTGKRGKPREWAFSHWDPHPGCKQPFVPTRLTWNHKWKLYLDGRLYNWERDPDEKSPIPADSPDAEARAARKLLQSGLDQMARVKAPVFNKFDTDGRPAY